MMKKLITSLLSIFLLLGLIIPGSIFAASEEFPDGPKYDNPTGNMLNIYYSFDKDVPEKDGTIDFNIRLTKNGVPCTNVQNIHYVVKAGIALYAGGQGLAHTDCDGYLKNEANFDLWSNLPMNSQWSLTVFDGQIDGQPVVENQLQGVSYEIIPYSGSSYKTNPEKVSGTINGSANATFKLQQGYSSNPGEIPVEKPVERLEASYDIVTRLVNKNYQNQPGNINAVYSVTPIKGDIEVSNPNFTAHYTGNNVSSSGKVTLLNARKGDQYGIRISLAKNIDGIDYSGKRYEIKVIYTVGDKKIDKVEYINSDISTDKYGDTFLLIAKSSQVTPQPSDPGVDDGPSIVEPTPPVDTTVHVNSVSVSPSTLTLNVGNSTTLTANVSPSNATNKSVSWTTGNRNVATVDANGRVIAVAGGDTYITAKTTDGSKTDSCHVTVNSPVVHKDPESITLSANKVELEIGGSYNLVATVLPADCQNKNVTWSSNNSGIATVSDGNIMAKGSGTTTITARTSNGKSQTCTVIVKEPVQQVKNVSNVVLRETKEVLTVGDSVVLHPTITPADATNKNVTWKSMDETIAIIEEGKVVAEKPGTVDIIVTTVDGNKTAKCTITVAQPQPTDKDIKVTGISLEQTSATLKNGQSLTLNETIAPKDASNKNVTWYSTNDNVAQVNEHGIVKAINAGTAEIVVTTEDGNKTAKCTLTVEKDEEVVVEPTEEFKPKEETTTPDPAPSEPTTPDPDPKPSEPSTPENPQPTPSTPTTKAVAVSYETHIENIGWGNIGYNGQDSGTTGRALRLEGIKINVSGDENLGIAYRTHVQDIGWMNYVSNGAMSGTEGQAKRLEAIQIQLTGADKDKYDVYYRVHAQDVGWMNWAKNGDSAGTAGFARRLEAIEIKVVPKGEVPAIPASTPNATNQAFLQKN